MLECTLSLACSLALVIGQVFVLPTARPHEPDPWSVCACDFQDNFWLHLVSGVLHKAQGGLHAHWHDTIFRNWLEQLQCDPWPVGQTDAVVNHAAGGVYFTDYRYGRIQHYLDPWLRGSTEVPRAILATRAACLPGRLLLHLLCAHRAMLPVHSGHADWDKFGEHVRSLHDMISLAVGNEYPLDLGSLKGRSSIGCAQHWPWSPFFADEKLSKLKQFVDGLLSAPIALDPPSLAYADSFALSVVGHSRINPYIQACVPFLDAGCWPLFAPSSLESCEHCCNPAAGSGQGEAECFDTVWTFERCCRPLTEPALQPKYDGDTICLDSNVFCRDWAEEGECNNEPEFMLSKCRLSCEVCAMISMSR